MSEKAEEQKISPSLTKSLIMNLEKKSYSYSRSIPCYIIQLTTNTTLFELFGMLNKPILTFSTACQKMPVRPLAPSSRNRNMSSREKDKATAGPMGWCYCQPFSISLVLASLLKWVDTCKLSQRFFGRCTAAATVVTFRALEGQRRLYLLG